MKFDNIIYILLLFLVLTIEASSAKAGDLQKEIIETVQFLNSKQFIKESIPTNLKGGSEGARNNLKNFRDFVADRPMPYFSSFGNAITMYDGNQKVQQFVILSHSPFSFYLDEKFYSYKDVQEFLEKYKSPLKKKYETSLFNIMIRPANADVFSTAAIGLLTYGAYRLGKRNGASESAAQSTLNQPTVLNHVVVPSEITTQTPTERKNNQYRSHLESISEHLIKTFPGKNCQSKNLVNEADVTYQRNNGVLSVNLKPKNEINNVEFRFNEVTGDSVDVVCDKSKNCKELSLTSPSINTLEKVWPNNFAGIKNQNDKLIKMLDDAGKEYESKRTKNSSKSVDEFIKERDISYPKATSISDIIKKISNPKEIEAIRLKFLEQENRSIESSNSNTLAPSIVSWYEKLRLTAKFNPKEFQEIFLKRVSELRTNNWTNDPIGYLAQGAFFTNALESRPIKLEENSKIFLNKFSVYKLSEEHANEFNKINHEIKENEFSQLIKQQEKYYSVIKKIQSEIGLDSGYAYPICLQASHYYRNRDIDSDLNELTKCNINEYTRIQTDKLTAKMNFPKLALDLKDFGACCLNSECKSLFQRKQTQLIKSNEEMRKGVQ